MSLSHWCKKARACPAPCVWRALFAISLMERPNACRPSSARWGTAAGNMPLNSAPNRLCRCCVAKAPSAASVVWPMPRLGAGMLGKNSGSSSLLSHSRNQAHRSLISARSKKLVPPDTLYGMLALRSAFSNGLARWLARYRMAKPFQSGGGLLAARRLWMRATARSASCSWLSATTTRTGSPSPNSLNSVLANSLGVGRYHMVGRAQDGVGGAVVLFELYDLELREVDGQLFQVVQRGAAPAVDRLVIVAHGGEMPTLAHQQPQQLVLRAIGVLVFVHQHMAQRCLPFGAQFGKVAQQPQRQADQVHVLVGRQALFVACHQRGDAALAVVCGPGQRLPGVQAHVLPLADGPLPLPGGGQVGGAAGCVLQDAGHVIGVEDAELRLEAQPRAIRAQ